jgi:hypothetical protein
MRLHPWSALLLLAAPLAVAGYNHQDSQVARDSVHRRQGLFDPPAGTTGGSSTQGASSGAGGGGQQNSASQTSREQNTPITTR